MAQPVWVLSVDLQTKTATFQSGLADAAKSARGAFKDIQGGAGEMGGSVNYSMMEARHSVMMLGEEFGVHLPRGVTSFIASLGPLGPALEAAFPFLAIAVGATILLEHLAKMHEAGEKLTADQISFGTAANNAFNALNEKLIQAQIKADELKGDHLGALKLQLELIDRQSMQELVHQFEELDKAALTVMKDLEGHWYTFGQGSDGAKHALDDFKSKYDAFLSSGTDEGKQQASGLLSGTLKQAQDVLKAQQIIKAARDSGGGQTDDSFAAEQLLKSKHASLAVTKAEIEAQEQIVDVLTRQQGVEERINKLKDLDSGNAKKQYSNDESAKRSAAARAAAESQARMGELSVQADKATAMGEAQVKQASIEELLALDLDFAGRERDVKLAANQAEIAALDKSGKDYINQLQSLNDKALEITTEYNTKVAELKAKASVEENQRTMSVLEQAIREEIEGTQQGSAQRLAVLSAAMRQEETLGLQSTAFYRDLAQQREETDRKAAEEAAKRAEEAGVRQAAIDEKLGMLSVQSLRDKYDLQNSVHGPSKNQQIEQAVDLANKEYAVKQAALQQQVAALDAGGQDYNNKLKELQQQELLLTEEHEQQIKQIKLKAQEDTNKQIQAGEQRALRTTNEALTQAIMGQKTWAQTVEQLGRQAVSTILQNAMLTAEAAAIGRESQAAQAARTAFVNTEQAIPGPWGVMAGMAMGALAFATVSGYADGTDAVPGVGRGDVVPAMLTPGEGVVPGGVMDGLRTIARNGGFNGQGQTVHVHVRPTYHVNTIDGDGMRGALEKHTDEIQRHVERSVRKMNR
jgi:hypothetical protein